MADEIYAVTDDLATTLMSNDGLTDQYLYAESFPLTEFLLVTPVPKVSSGKNVLRPLSSLTYTSYSPTFIGEGLVLSLPIPGSTFTLSNKPIVVASGANVAVPLSQFELTNSIGVYRVQLVVCTGEPAPLEHIKDSKKLDSDAYTDLFQIILSDRSSTLFLKMNKDITWQGDDYEGTTIHIEGVGAYADDEVSRPKLSIFNPEGIFTSLVNAGLVDNATVIRIRVLNEHIEDDLPIYRRNQWRVSRVVSTKKPFIVLELRDMLDGQNFQTPGRMFMPPDFPVVNLS